MFLNLQIHWCGQLKPLNIMGGRLKYDVVQRIGLSYVSSEISYQDLCLGLDCHPEVSSQQLVHLYQSCQQHSDHHCNQQRP